VAPIGRLTGGNQSLSLAHYGFTSGRDFSDVQETPATGEDFTLTELRWQKLTSSVHYRIEQSD